MKLKYDIVILLNYLRAKTDPKFHNDDGVFYDPKISKTEKYNNLIRINLLKWILSDYEYDQNDIDRYDQNDIDRDTKHESLDDLK